MTPKVKVKFRKRNNVPFAIEKLTGVQYRCRVCNEIFLEKDELDKHLEIEYQRGAKDVSSNVPEVNSNLFVKVLYTLDLTDRMKRHYLKNKRDQYDDLWS
jgi:hypothetical protein